MNGLEFTICDWLGAARASDPNDVTQAFLRIDAGSQESRVALTEVHDALAGTVRAHINVSVYPLARWLLLNWWRLRWEPQRDTHDWHLAHSMASIGEGFAWPPLTFSSDGDFVQVHLPAEHAPDVAAVRYLNEVAMDVPAADFETAVDQLVNHVEGRLSACRSTDRDVCELRQELAEERLDTARSRACRLQASAGIAPGDAPDGWLADAERLSGTTGPEAIGEVLAVLPELRGGLAGAREEVDRIRRSKSVADLSWVRPSAEPTGTVELPWQRGARLACDLRRQLGIGTAEPVSDQTLGDRLGVHLPFPAAGRGPLRGGFRNGDARLTHVAVPSPHPDSQRFHLARLLACAFISPAADHLLPVTAAATAMQKYERAFAQELLCPVDALGEFIAERGNDDEAIADAAAHFRVSDWLVRSALVNHKVLPRHRLPWEVR